MVIGRFLYSEEPEQRRDDSDNRFHRKMAGTIMTYKWCGPELTLMAIKNSSGG